MNGNSRDDSGKNIDHNMEALSEVMAGNNPENNNGQVGGNENENGTSSASQDKANGQDVAEMVLRKNH